MSTCRAILPRLAPERQAHGDFLLPSGALRQLQIGDVGAGQQQNKSRRAHEHQNELACIHS